MRQPATLPTSPEYREIDAVPKIPQNGILLVQNQTIPVIIDFLGPNDKEVFHPAYLMDMRNQETSAILQGFFKYEDAFGRTHEVRFCYPYAVKKNGNTWGGTAVLDGPRGYNQAT